MYDNQPQLTYDKTVKFFTLTHARKPTKYIKKKFKFQNGSIITNNSKKKTPKNNRFSLSINFN